MSTIRPPSTQAAELLQLLQWPRVGPAKVRQLVRTVDSSKDLLALARRRMPDAAKAADADRHKIAARVDEIVDRCASIGIAVLSMLDEAYPAMLQRIEDAPPIIYVRGDLAALPRPAVAVVGTRHASEPGRKAAHTIARYLAESKIVVVSGLALGIDTSGHLGALEAGGTTVAVLAHGLDTIAPTSNRALGERIVATGGALVSEHPPGVPPRPPEFARRNRIQSGLSFASVVVESGATGGAMIQAGFTKEQGRKLLAVFSKAPGFNADGSQRLVAEFSASSIAGTADLRRVLSQLSPASDLGRPQGELEWQ